MQGEIFKKASYGTSRLFKVKKPTKKTSKPKLTNSEVYCIKKTPLATPEKLLSMGERILCLLNYPDLSLTADTGAWYRVLFYQP